MTPVRYHAAFADDLRVAIEFYGNDAVTASRIWDVLESVEALMVRHPTMFRLFDEPLRRAYLAPFDLFLVYIVDADGVHVLALLDGRRDPAWNRSELNRRI